MRNFGQLWKFETARFTILWDISLSDFPDTSWDETGETQDKLNSGEWTCFDSTMSLLLDGIEIASTHLGQSIYENPDDFRDHFGMNGKGHGSYFSGMVRKVIAEGRKALSNPPRLRAIA